MRSNLKDWCIEHSREDLLQQWDYEKNAPLTPETCAPGSGKKVWWKCGLGHEWDVAPYTRTGTNKAGCPICSGKRVLAGYNDLATTYPELALEWNYEKNSPLLPTQVTVKSAKKVWWTGKCNHTWSAIISSRTSGTGCPVCDGKQILVGYNDLATTFPEIAKEWHPTKNGILLPTQVIRGTTKKVWWKCAKGHEWEARVASRTDKTFKQGCPFCSGRYAIAGETDLLTISVELAKEWDYERNGELSPNQVKIGTHQKVWWRCKKGHSYSASIHSRTNMNSGCPICAKGLQTSFPEKAIYYFVSKAFPDAVDNYHCDWLGRLELDIYIPQLHVAIEYDGKAWHRGKRSDQEKGRLCTEHGVQLLRIREPGCHEVQDGSIQYNLQSMNIKDLNSAIVFALNFCGAEKMKIDVEAARYDIYTLTERLEKERSLARCCPDLVDEWYWEKNGILTPENVSAYGNTRVWWKCKKGHEWESVLANRSRLGRGCPVCAGKKVLSGENDLLTLYPDLAVEWNYEKNGELRPENVRPGTHQKAWWICKECKNVWEAEIKSRVSGRGCPSCARKKKV